MKRQLATLGIAALMLTVYACSKQTPSSGNPKTGSIKLSSEVAGMVLIDGAETGRRVKAQGSILIENVDTGMTETAVLLDDGTMAKAQEMALVKAGETVEVHIAVTAVVPPETPAQTTQADPPKQAETPAPAKATEPPKQEAKAAQTAPSSVPTVKTENDANALNISGLSYGRNGDYDRAITDFTAALRIKPDYYVALSNRGIAYYYKSDYDKAIADYTAALRIQPDFTDALYNRGIAYGRINDNDKAIADYTAALRIKPDFANALNNRGNAYYHKGDLDHAIADWEAVLRLDPNNTDVKQNLEILRQQRGY